MQPREVTLKGDQVAGLSLARVSLTGQLQTIAVDGVFGVAVVASSTIKRIHRSVLLQLASRETHFRVPA